MPNTEGITRLGADFAKYQNFEAGRTYINPPDHTNIFFAYWITTKIGRSNGITTCRQACEHCFLRTTSPQALGYYEPLEEAEQHIQGLQAAGFQVEPFIPDIFASFAPGAYYLERTNLFKKAKGDKGPENGWTSGTPLVCVSEDEAMRLIGLARDKNGIDHLQFTAHQLPSYTTPIRGGARFSTVDAALQRVALYNQTHEAGLTTGLTLTIGTHNATGEFLAASIQQISKLYPDLVTTIRLNSLAAHRPDLVKLQLDHASARKFLLEADQVARANRSNIRITVSDDFGETPELGIPRCNGGQTSFAVTFPKIWLCTETMINQIGEIVPIVDSTSGNITSYAIAWDTNLLDTLNAKGGIKDTEEGSCVGHAMSLPNLGRLQIKYPTLTRQFLGTTTIKY